MHGVHDACTAFCPCIHVHTYKHTNARSRARRYNQFSNRTPRDRYLRDTRFYEIQDFTRYDILRDIRDTNKINRGGFWQKPPRSFNDKHEAFTMCVQSNGLILRQLRFSNGLFPKLRTKNLKFKIYRKK